jgi:hypothetical protein
VPRKPLVETNPYLRDAAKRRDSLIANVSSSTSVETGRKPETIARALARDERAGQIKSRQGSGR